MGCICKCHDEGYEFGCCWKCEAEHDPLRNALAALKWIMDQAKNAGEMRGMAEQALKLQALRDSSERRRP